MTKKEVVESIEMIEHMLGLSINDFKNKRDKVGFIIDVMNERMALQKLIRYAKEDKK